MTSPERRLPVYLLLDCSESMAGEGIEDMSAGVNTMLAVLRKNPFAIETAYLSVITFSRVAEQVMPLTELTDFQRPEFSVRTGTAMGAALRILAQSIDRDVRKTTSVTKGDYRPLVFLFSDGQPTDEWEEAAATLRGQTKPRIANIYAIGCSPDVDTDVLRRITDIVLVMRETSHAAWQQVFIWISASVAGASEAVHAGMEAASSQMVSAPDVLEPAPPLGHLRDEAPRQVFLHAFCSGNGKPYLMRFRREPGGRQYIAQRSHPLESVEEDGGEGLPPIDTSLLVGCPACPYCENPTAIVCGCGTVLCWAEDATGPAECPNCHQQGMATPTGPQGFHVRRIQG